MQVSALTNFHTFRNDGATHSSECLPAGTPRRNQNLARREPDLFYFSRFSAEMGNSRGIISGGTLTITRYEKWSIYTSQPRHPKTPEPCTPSLIQEPRQSINQLINQSYAREFLDLFPSPTSSTSPTRPNPNTIPPHTSPTTYRTFPARRESSSAVLYSIHFHPGIPKTKPPQHITELPNIDPSLPILSKVPPSTTRGNHTLPTQTWCILQTQECAHCGQSTVPFPKCTSELSILAGYIRHGRSNLPVHDCENVSRSGPVYGSGVGHGSGAEGFGPGGT